MFNLASNALTSAKVLMWSDELEWKTTVVLSQLHSLKLADLFSARLLFPDNSEMTVLNILASSGSTWKHRRKTQLRSCHSLYSKLPGIPQLVPSSSMIPSWKNMQEVKFKYRNCYVKIKEAKFNTKQHFLFKSYNLKWFRLPENWLSWRSCLIRMLMLYLGQLAVQRLE